MTQKDQKGSMITDTFTINLGHCVHARVVVYMYLIFVMTGQNISATKDCKFALVRRSLNLVFIREYKFGMHQCWMHAH